MASIKFDITGDNTNFLNSMKQVQTSVKQTSSVLSSIGKNFDVSDITRQIVSLTKIINENDAQIKRTTDDIAKRMEVALNFRSKGNFTAFDAIQEKIDKEADGLKQLTEETEKYRAALNELLAAEGRMQGATAPMFFGKREDYEAYEAMLRKREEIQSRIANFDSKGMSNRDTTARLVEMRSQLSVLNEEIGKTELSAAKAAAELGENGERASEAAVHYYEMTKAVEEQIAKVNDLQLKLNDANEKMVTAVNAKDVFGAEDAQVEVDSLAESLRSAKIELVNLETEAKSAEDAFKDYGDTSVSLRMQMRQTTMELASLTLEYRQMSDEEKKSTRGREILAKMDELQEKAGELRDTMNDVNRAVMGESSDTRTFDAMAGGFNVLTSSIGAATGVMAMFGVEEKDLLDVQAKLQASLAISNALSVVQNNLQKESAMMIGINTLQKKAAVVAENLDTAAKGRNIIATKAATVAQKAFNLVAKANPYVLLATAIVTVIGALWAFSSASKRATEEEEKQKKAAEELAKAQKEMQEALGSSVGSVEARFTALQTSWKKLKSTADKMDFVKKHANDFRQLGLNVKSVADAEDVLVRMAPQVINALRAVSEASVFEKLRSEAFAKRETFRYSKKTTQNGGYYTPLTEGEKNTFVPAIQREWTEAGLTEADYRQLGKGNDKRFRLEQSGIDKINAYREKKARETRLKIQKEYDDELNYWDKKWNEAQDKAVEAQSKIPKSLWEDGGDGGDGENKKDEALTYTQKEYDRQIKERERIEKERIDKENAIEEARIANIENNAERERAARENQHRLTLQQIDLMAEEFKKKNVEAFKEQWSADASNKGKSWVSTDIAQDILKNGYANVKLTADQQAIIESKRQQELANIRRENEERLNEEKQYLLDYIKEYGDVQQQRAAITKEYDKKIAEESNDIQKAALEKQKESLIAELNMKELQQSIDWESVFNNLETQSTNALEDLKAKLVEALDAKDITAENAKVIAEKIREIEETLLRRKDPYSSWMPGLRERRRLTEEIYEIEQKIHGLESVQGAAQGRQNTALGNLATLLNTSEGAIRQRYGNITTDVVEEMFGSFDIANASQEVRDAFEQLRLTTIDLTTADSNLLQAQKDRQTRQEAFTNFTKGGSIGQYFKDVTQGMDFGGYVQLANDNVQSMNDLVKNIGLSNTEFGKGVEEFAKGTQGFANAVQAFAKGDVVGAVNGIVEGLQGYGSVIERIGGFSFNGSNADEINKEIAMLTQKNEDLIRALDYLREEIKNGRLGDALDNYARAIDYQNDVIKNQQRILNDEMDYHGAHHSFGYYWEDEWLSGYKGKKGLENWSGSLRDLTPEEAAVLSSYSEVRDLIRNTGKGGYGDSVLRALDELAETAGKLDDITKEFYERITSVSFDTMYSSFVDKLKNMDAKTKDFANDFEGYLRDAIYNAMSEDEIKPLLQQWYAAFASYMSDGELTAEERNALLHGGGSYKDIQTGEEKEFKSKDAITEVGLMLRDTIESLGLYNGQSTSGQSNASYNAANNITYEQADSMVGIGYNQSLLLERGNTTRDLILAGLNAQNELINGDGGVIDLIAQGNHERVSIHKTIKNMRTLFDERMSEVIKELKES